MAPANVDKQIKPLKSQVKKLARLPKNARIQKRPILRPTIPSSYAGADQQKVVYVSTKTPFIAAVKRVRKLLAQVEKRSMGEMKPSKNNDKQRLHHIIEKMNQPKIKEPEEVVLKATNRAIEKVLGLALYFQGQDDCKVRLKTGTVSVVDDIIVSDDATSSKEDDEAGADVEDLPESRVRKATVVEAAISLK